MARRSIFEQLPGSTQVLQEKLLPSPRHWNAGLLHFGKKLWLVYRHHLQTADARCAIAICSIDDRTFQPMGKSRVLEFPGAGPGDHFEDPRLFVFKEKLHISYTRMRGYKPGVDYNCTVEYAELALTQRGWVVKKIFHPVYGQNHGFGKEKNWVFWEYQGRLYCFYQGYPKHIVLLIEGNRVENELESEPAVWPWGTIRGGATPMWIGKNLLHIFHSSLPTETPPHYVRYFAGACMMQGVPPFAPISISPRPIAAGSEEDGHQVDPRYFAGWKPFVVFPCGCVTIKKQIFISMGVNDWQTVISPIKLDLIDARGLDVKPRYFMTPNGSIPHRVLVVDGGEMKTDWIQWEVPRPGANASAGVGYLKSQDARISEELSTEKNVREIDEQIYLSATATLVRR